MKTFYHREFKSQGEEKEQYNVFFDPGRKRLVRLPRRSKWNGFWRKKLATWYAKQIDEEGVKRWDLVNEWGWELYVRELKAAGGRYKGWEQRDGVVVVASVIGRRELPKQFEDRVEIVDHWLAWAKLGKRVKGPRDFGGKYAGSRPGGWGASGWIWLDVKLEDAVEIMKGDKVELEVEGQDHVRIKTMKVGKEGIEDYIMSRFVSVSSG